MSDDSPPSSRGRAYFESAVPAPDSDPFEGMMDLPAWSGPSELMVQALELVQRDLAAAGLAQFVMSYAVAGGSDDDPIVNVNWWGGGGGWTSDTVDLGGDDAAQVTADVAGHAAQGLVEVEGVYWPTCPTHNVRARAAVDHRGRPVWACKKRGVTPHPLSVIGELDHAQPNGRQRRPLWRTLERPAKP